MCVYSDNTSVGSVSPSSEIPIVIRLASYVSDFEIKQNHHISNNLKQ